MNAERINALLNIENFDRFFNLVFHPNSNSTYSLNSKELVHLIFKANQSKLTEEECKLLAGGSFNFCDFKQELYGLADECLLVKGKNFYVRRSKYKEWRKIVMINGQDLFACALNSPKYKKYRTFIIPMEKSHIDSAFDDGYAENHCHYNVAGPAFYCNWLFLHNGVPFHAPITRIERGERKKEFLNYYSESEYYRFFNVSILAIYLRLLLHRSFVKNKKISILDVSNLKISFAKLGKKNDTYKNVFFKEIENISYSTHSRNKGVHDYCCDPKEKIQLFGERQLLSTCFNKFDQVTNDLKALLILYLIVKKFIESYFVQNNYWYGFNNFRRYERLFELFFPNAKYAKTKVDKWTSLYLTEDDKLKKLEIRLAPKANYAQMRDRAKRCGESFGKNPSLKTGLVYHFIKETRKLRSSKKLSGNLTQPRSWDKIKEYRHQLTAIKKMAKYGKKSLLKFVGIDAANEEIRCRPEVFAPFYRAMRTYPNIKRTFHVGEDFTFITDGLRAMNEAIKYLDLGEKDRLGHGSAVATNIDKYFVLKGRHFISSKQDMLDDYCFLYTNTKAINAFNSFNKSTVDTINKLLEEIYGFADIDAYLLSLELRGDHPNVYKGLSKIGTYNEEKSKWKDKRKEYYLNGAFKGLYKKAWNNQNALTYIFRYHYYKDVRDKGDEVCMSFIGKDYIEAIKRAQDNLAKLIVKKKIGIETNPTSNYLIGPFVDFEDVPAICFDNGKLAKKDVLVSIGTDDPGLFFTNLRNEYNSLIYYYAEEENMNQTEIIAKMKKLAKRSMDLSFIE